jgi:hypothetical protein
MTILYCLHIGMLKENRPLGFHYPFDPVEIKGDRDELLFSSLNFIFHIVLETCTGVPHTLAICYCILH